MAGSEGICLSSPPGLSQGDIYQSPDLCPQGSLFLLLKRNSGERPGFMGDLGLRLAWVHGMARVRGVPWVCGWLGFVGRPGFVAGLGSWVAWVCGWLGFEGSLGSRGGLGSWGAWVCNWPGRLQAPRPHPLSPVPLIHCW